MSFSYTPQAVNDITRVRFHTGDTLEAEAYLSDEEIQMMIDEEGGWKPAVIAALKFIIAKLSQPNFDADWLKVDLESARRGYQALLKQKAAELGVTLISARSQPTYRSDSLQTEAPEGW